jgi:hypothetical protein
VGPRVFSEYKGISEYQGRCDLIKTPGGRSAITGAGTGNRKMMKSQAQIERHYITEVDN